jgi:hypothetical protein
MNEPVEMVVERSAVQSAQALLLARIFATVLTLVVLIVGLMVSTSASKFGAMFAELGTDAQLPMISTIAFRHGGGILVALLALSAVTTFFVWANGKVAAWMAGMAGMGLLLMAVFVPIMVSALFLPLAKIISEMGSM